MPPPDPDALSPTKSGLYHRKLTPENDDKTETTTKYYNNSSSSTNNSNGKKLPNFYSKGNKKQRNGFFRFINYFIKGNNGGRANNNYAVQVHRRLHYDFDNCGTNSSSNDYYKGGKKRSMIILKWVIFLFVILGSLLYVIFYILLPPSSSSSSSSSSFTQQLERANQSWNQQLFNYVHLDRQPSLSISRQQLLQQNLELKQYNTHEPNNNHNNNNSLQPKLSQAAQKYLDWSYDSKSKFQNVYLSRQQQRKQRTTIEHSILDEYQNYLYTFDFLQQQQQQPITNTIKGEEQEEQGQSQKQTTSCGIETELAAKQYPHLYPDIHSINEDSTIVITGILSRIGFNLALKLATECNVQKIIGIDPMLPNEKTSRMRKIEQLHILYQSIPQLQKTLLIPYVGFSPKEGYPVPYYSQYIDDKTGEIDFSFIEPTHVIHIMSIDDYSVSSYDVYDSMYILNPNIPDTGGTIGQNGKNPMFGVRQNIIGFDNLISTLINGRKNNVDHKPIHFTLVSDTNVILPQQQCESGESSSKRVCQDGFRSTAKLMEEMMFQFYSNRGIAEDTFVTIRLPLVYGPWGDPGDIDYDIAESVVQNWANITNPLADVEKNFILDLLGRIDLKDQGLRDVLFVDDAVSAITTVMQYRKDRSSPTSFNVMSGERISVSQLANYISIMARGNNFDMTKPLASDLTLKYLNFEPKVNVKTGIAKLLAWHLNEYHHHGTWYPRVTDEVKNIRRIESGYQLLKREAIPLCEGGIYCHRGRIILPCASECSDDLMCTKTGFDESQSNPLTKDCRNVIYTSFYDPNIEKIKMKAPIFQGGAFCNIAFVPHNSKFVMNNPGIKEYNGWKIVTVDLNNDNARGLDKKWLPKLSPGKLFHPQVRYAIYLQDNLLESPKLDDILFIKDFMNEDKKEVMILLSALELNSKKPQIKAMSTLEAKEKISEYRQLKNPIEKQALQRRIALYQQVMMLLNRCEFSPRCHQMYKYKLRHWVKTKWIIHDLQSNDAKNLRCDWYKEQTKFDDNFDEISFAHVMAEKDIEHFLYLSNDGNNDDNDRLFEMLERNKNEEMEQWIPVGKKRGDSNYVRVVDTQTMVDRRYLWDRERKDK